jgi:PAS domain S-box-containing protein
VISYPEKLTKAYPHPANLGYCDFTGCSVMSPPEWRVVEPDYACGVGFMDGQIIFSLPWGRGSETGIKEYLKIMYTIFEDHLAPDSRVVVIDDFSRYHGITQRARKAYIKGLKMRPEVAGIVCYNLSPYFRFNLGIGRRLHMVPYPIEFAADYKAAIMCASRILDAPIGRVDPRKPSPTEPSEPLSPPQFPLIGEHSALGMHVDYRRVTDDVLQLQIRGRATIAGVDGIVQNRQANLMPTWGERQCNYVIVEIEDMSQFPLDVIGHYAKHLGTDTRRAEIKLIILVGEQAFTNAAERFTRMRIPAQVIEAKTFEEASCIIACHREGTSVPPDLDLPAPESIHDRADLADALIHVLSHTRWDLPGPFTVSERYPPKHELRLLLDALDTIKSDVDMMLDNQRQQVAQIATSADIIEESEQQFRALFDVAADGILVIDRDGTIVDSNPAAATMFRTSPEGLNGLSALAILPAIEGFEQEATTQLKHDVNDVQVTAHTKHGHTFPARISLRHTEPDAGAHTIAYVHDSSESVAVQQAILDTTQEVTRRIGGDLHDSLGQKLVGAFYLAQALAKRLNDASPELKTQLETVLGVLQDSINETRTLARGLNPADHAGGGFITGLTHFTGEARKLYEIEIALHIEMSEADIPEKTATHLHHIVQESVNNAVRHGHASTITISLSKLNSGTGLLTIQDNGRGFEAQSEDTPRVGMGLRLMRYRTDLIGGEFEASSCPTEGVKLSCTFAIQQAATGTANVSAPRSQ